MATPIFHSGFTGTATVNGTELPIIGWAVNPLATLVEFRNSKSGGFVVRESTFKDATFHIKFDYDFANNPFIAPLSLFPGAALTNVKLYLNNGTSGDGWTFPLAIVETTPQSLEVNGRIETSITCRGNGAFAVPGN